MTVRRAAEPDLSAMLDLAAERRADYASRQPRFWRPAEDARSRQSDYFASLLDDPQTLVLVDGDTSDEVTGFVIARLVGSPPVYDPGGPTCLVDDFTVRDPSDWSTAGGALLDAVRSWAAEHDATQLVAVTGQHDQPKREALRSAGLAVASEWWVAGLEPGVAVSDTERAVYGPVTMAELRAFLDAWARKQLGSGIAKVRFRAGRIDVVWGVDLEDGRAVVVKTHRTPVDLAALRAAREAQRLLAAAAYPCPVPLAGPDEVEGRVLTAETLIEGEVPDGRDPTTRRLLAEGLVRHIELLRGQPELRRGAGAGPSWCRYQAGPWPVPHDTIVDFRSTPSGFEWLDTHGRRAADQILAHRDADDVVVGHADWYAGNTAVGGGALVGTFDWELVADTEAVIAGFAAACYASSATGGGGLSTPEEVAAFLIDYDVARGRPLSDREQRAAAGSAAWILAFNARWQVALIDLGHGDEATVALVRDRREDYLSLTW